MGNQPPQPYLGVANGRFLQCLGGLDWPTRCGIQVGNPQVPPQVG